MASVSFKKAQRWYPGAESAAVQGLDLDIEDGELMVLVGPAGCGSSTALRMLAGLEEVTDGEIYIGDREVTHVPPKDRDIAMVFQNYSLYSSMSVADNMGFALKMAKIPPAERQKRVEEAARVLGLSDCLECKPKALSGGQRQRVAMGRAIVRQPQVLCMDEPLSNLDAEMRNQTRADIAALQADLGVTTVYVTHDPAEAMTLGDRVAVLKDGLLHQVASPLELYDRPANLFVAGFIGSPGMNLIDASPSDGRVVVGTYEVPIDPATAARITGDVTVGVRPEAWRIVGEDENALTLSVGLVEDLGADWFVHGELEGAHQPVVVRTAGRSDVERGETIRVAVDPEQVHVFDAATGERLGD